MAQLAAGGHNEEDISHDASRVLLLPELLRHIAALAPNPNDVPTCLRLLSRTSAVALRGPPFNTIRTSLPVPPADLRAAWCADGGNAARRLPLRHRRRLMALAAASGADGLPTLQALERACACPVDPKVLRAAAASGDVPTAAWVLAKLDELCAAVAPQLPGGLGRALEAAAAAGQGDMCDWLLAQIAARWDGGTASVSDGGASGGGASSSSGAGAGNADGGGTSCPGDGGGGSSSGAGTSADGPGTASGSASAPADAADDDNDVEDDGVAATNQHGCSAMFGSARQPPRPPAHPGWRALRAAAAGGHSGLARRLLMMREWPREALAGFAQGAAEGLPLADMQAALCEWLPAAPGFAAFALRRTRTAEAGGVAGLAGGREQSGAVLAAAAASATPDWRDKVEWLEAAGAAKTARAAAVVLEACSSPPSLALGAAGPLPLTPRNSALFLTPAPSPKAGGGGAGGAGGGGCSGGGSWRERLTWLLGRGYPVDSSALGAAVRCGNAEAVTWLLGSSADADSATGGGRGDRPRLQVRVVAGGDVAKTAVRGQVGVMAALAAAGVPAAQLAHVTLAEVAARSGQTEVVEWMLRTAMTAAAVPVVRRMVAAAAEEGEVVAAAVAAAQARLAAAAAASPLAPSAPEAAVVLAAPPVPLAAAVAGGAVDAEDPPLPPAAGSVAAAVAALNLLALAGPGPSGSAAGSAAAASEEAAAAAAATAAAAAAAVLAARRILTEDLFEAAAGSGCVPLLENLLDAWACPAGECAVAAAVEAGGADALEYLVRRAVPSQNGGDPYVLAACAGDLATLANLQRLGLSQGPLTLRGAAAEGAPRWALEWLVRAGLGAGPGVAAAWDWEGAVAMALRARKGDGAEVAGWLREEMQRALQRA